MDDQLAAAVERDRQRRIAVGLDPDEITDAEVLARIAALVVDPPEQGAA